MTLRKPDFQIAEATEADMELTFEVFSEAFNTKIPFISLLWPEHMTPKGRADGTKRWLDMLKNSKESSKFFKICDPQTGRLCAQAKWDLAADSFSADSTPDEGYWSKEDKDEADRLGGVLLKTRAEAFREYGGAVICLDILTILPAYQRRGLGHLLLKWGTDLADQKQVPCVLECPADAKTFYESAGFQAKTHIVLDYNQSRPWATTENDIIWFMVRMPQ